MKKIELFYFAGCPSYLAAVQSVEAALQAEGVPTELTLVPVESEADAQEKRLIGSPTVRIDGIDLEGIAAEERGYGLGCRVYRDGDQLVGCPPVELVRRGLAGISLLG